MSICNSIIINTVFPIKINYNKVQFSYFSWKIIHICLNVVINGFLIFELNHNKENSAERLKSQHLRIKKKKSWEIMIAASISLNLERAYVASQIIRMQIASDFNVINYTLTILYHCESKLDGHSIQYVIFTKFVYFIKMATGNSYLENFVLTF